MNRDRSLEDIEGDRWGEPDFPSGLVTRCHEARKKPLAELTVTELATLINQDTGREHIVPLAIKRASVDPWLERDYFAGELLLSFVNNMNIYQHMAEDHAH